MKTRWLVTILLIVSLCVTGGCSKKETPGKAPSEPDARESTNVMDGMKEAADQATQTAQKSVKEAAENIKQSLSTDIDLDKTISDLKTEAAKMDIETLTQVAAKYRDAIVGKQASLENLMNKLKAIPVTEQLSEDAKGLTEEIKTVSEAIKPLAERLGVYIEALKAKGADVSGLTVE